MLKELTLKMWFSHCSCSEIVHAQFSRGIHEHRGSITRRYRWQRGSAGLNRRGETMLPLGILAITKDIERDTKNNEVNRNFGRQKRQHRAHGRVQWKGRRECMSRRNMAGTPVKYFSPAHILLHVLPSPSCSPPAAFDGFPRNGRCGCSLNSLG